MYAREDRVPDRLIGQAVSAPKFGYLTLQGTPRVETGLPFVSRLKTSLGSDDNTMRNSKLVRGLDSNLELQVGEFTERGKKSFHYYQPINREILRSKSKRQGRLIGRMCTITQRRIPRRAKYPLFNKRGMDIRITIAENARRIRLAKGLTQAQVASRLGVDRAHVSSLEQGQRNPTATTLWEIAQALEVKISDLFADNESQADD